MQFSPVSRNFTAFEYIHSTECTVLRHCQCNQSDRKIKNKMTEKNSFKDKGGCSRRHLCVASPKFMLEHRL